MSYASVKLSASKKGTEVLVLPKLSLTEARRACIVKALEKCDGCAGKAATLLDIGNSTMYRLINDLGITDEERYGQGSTAN